MWDTFPRVAARVSTIAKNRERIFKRSRPRLWASKCFLQKLGRVLEVK